MSNGEFAFTIIYNAGLIIGSIYMAVFTVNRVLNLKGSRFRRVVTAVVLFPTVLGWLATFILGAFDDFDHALITIDHYLRVMQVTLILLIVLFYIWNARPSDPDDKD